MAKKSISTDALVKLAKKNGEISTDIVQKQFKVGYAPALKGLVSAVEEGALMRFSKVRCKTLYYCIPGTIQNVTPFERKVAEKKAASTKVEFDLDKIEEQLADTYLKQLEERVLMRVAKELPSRMEMILKALCGAETGVKKAA